MGRRKGKRRGHGAFFPAQAPMAAASEDVLRAEAETFLAQGKTGGALNRARVLFTRFPGSGNEQLCADAYERRLRHLAASGRTGQLAETAAAALADIPDRHRYFTELWIGMALHAGDAGPLATELTRPDRSAEDDAVAARVVVRHLVDPAVLADAAGIPAQHPLRIQAAAVRDAFRAVTSGPAGPGTLAVLDAIPRRSPLAPWRLLIQAVAALYAGDLARLDELLAALTDDSACAALRTALRALAGVDERALARAEPAPAGVARQPSAPGRPSSGRDDGRPSAKAERLLVAAVRGVAPDDDLRERLRKLDDDLRLERTSPFLTGLERLLLDLRTRRAALAREVALQAALLWARGDLAAEPLLELLGRHLRSPEAERVLALASEVAEPVSAPDNWRAFLRAAERAKWFADAPLERSLVLLRIAVLADEHLPSPDDVRRTARSLGFPGNVFHGGEFEQAYSMVRGMVLGGERVDPLEAARQAHQACPASETFRAIVGLLLRRGRAADAEAEAQEWHRVFPGEPEPLLFLLERFEKRGAIRKALAIVEEAERAGRIDPRIREGRFRLHLAGAEKRLREGKLRAAEADLGALAVLPETVDPRRRAYVLGLRVLAAEAADRLDDATQFDDELRVLLGRDGAVEAPLLLRSTWVALRTTLSDHGRDRLDVPTNAPADRLAVALARHFGLLAVVRRPAALDPAVVERVERHLAGARVTEGPPPGLSAAELLALARGADGFEGSLLASHAAALGIRTDGPSLARLLLARGRALSRLFNPDAAHACFRAALAVGRRLRDETAMREAAERLGDDDCDCAACRARRSRGRESGMLGPEELSTVLATERARFEPPECIPPETADPTDEPPRQQGLFGKLWERMKG